MIKYNHYDLNTFNYLTKQYIRYKNFNKYKYINLIYDYIYPQHNISINLAINKNNIENYITTYKIYLINQYKNIKYLNKNIPLYYNAHIKDLLFKFYHMKTNDETTINNKIDKLLKKQSEINNKNLLDYIKHRLIRDLLKQYAYYIYISKQVIKILLYLLNYYKKLIYHGMLDQIIIENITILIYDINYLPKIFSFIDLFKIIYCKLIKEN